MKMTIGKVVDELLKNYEYSKSQNWIEKPFSWALYQTWKWADEKENKNGTS